MEYEILKDHHQRVRDDFPPELNLRVHRALSWWHRALMADDYDGQFIFLWIAFNAAYASEIHDSHWLSEQETFKAFLQKLCALDKDKQIDALVWQEFSGNIRVLLDNPYVFQSFWDWQSGKIGEEDWLKRFERGKKQANQALSSGNTAMLLGLIFNRLYTLRNQLVHGGATWNSSVNRRQLRDCVSLLGKLVPLLISLMLENPNTLWGRACYPLVPE